MFFFKTEKTNFKIKTLSTPGLTYKNSRYRGGPGNGTFSIWHDSENDYSLILSTRLWKGLILLKQQFFWWRSKSPLFIAVLCKNLWWNIQIIIVRGRILREFAYPHKTPIWMYRQGGSCYKWLWNTLNINGPLIWSIYVPSCVQSDGFLKLFCVALL